MGYNTTIVVLNDGLNQIEKDPQIGKKLADAITSLSTAKYLAEKEGRPFHGIDVSAGCHANAIQVVETHHADQTAIVAVGGNYGREVIPPAYLFEGHQTHLQLCLLKRLASELGYTLRKTTK